VTDDLDSYPEQMADAALRRAAQLQAEAAERIEGQALARSSDRLTRADLVAVARDVGIGEEYLSLALAEVEQEGADALAPLTPSVDAKLTRWLGSKHRSLSVSHRYHAPAKVVLAQLTGVFESDDYRLVFDGHSGDPLDGGVMRFRMPKLSEQVASGSYSPLGYRLEQIEAWNLQVTVHEQGEYTEVVVYADLRRGARRNTFVAQLFTGTMGLAGAISIALLCLSSGMGALALLPALGASLGLGGATMAGYRVSYSSALDKAQEQLKLLLIGVERRLELGVLAATDL